MGKFTNVIENMPSVHTKVLSDCVLQSEMGVVDR
jgi:hypothetical protein